MGVAGLSWSKDSARLFCTHINSGTVTAMDAHSGKPLWQLAGKLAFDGDDTDICISPDGRQYATAVSQDRLYTWDAMQGTPVHDYGPIFSGPRPSCMVQRWPASRSGGRDGGTTRADASGILGNPANRISTTTAVAGVPPGRRMGRPWPEAERTFSYGPRTPKIRTRSFMLTDAEVAKLAWGANNSTLAAGLDNNKVRDPRNAVRKGVANLGARRA